MVVAVKSRVLLTMCSPKYTTVRAFPPMREDSKRKVVLVKALFQHSWMAIIRNKSEMEKKSEELNFMGVSRCMEEVQL